MSTCDGVEVLDELAPGGLHVLGVLQLLLPVLLVDDVRRLFPADNRHGDQSAVALELGVVLFQRQVRGVGLDVGLLAQPSQTAVLGQK